MAYFSNGTEGMMYQEQWCDRCQNFRDLDDGRGHGCPIWDAHLLYAYEECGKKSNAKSILDLLIPAGSDHFPAQCSMFLETPTPETP
jgi:hypothetical protein